MEATLLLGAGAGDHIVRKQETASLGDQVAASAGTRVVNSQTGDLTGDVAGRCATGKLLLHADAAEGRADARARRGVNLDAARRVKEQSAAKARLHEMAMGISTRDAKRLTSCGGGAASTCSLGSCRGESK